MAHNVITSGLYPKHMGWTDEAYRDTENLFGRGTDAMHITGDLSLADFGTLITHEGYPKLADYLHDAFPETKFIVVGEKSYAVESAVAPTGDIGVRMSGRSSSTLGRVRHAPRGSLPPAGGQECPGLPARRTPLAPEHVRAVLHQLRGRAVPLRHPGPRSRHGSTPRTATASSRGPTRPLSRVTRAATSGSRTRRSR